MESKKRVLENGKTQCGCECAREKAELLEKVKLLLEKVELLEAQLKEKEDEEEKRWENPGPGGKLEGSFTCADCDTYVQYYYDDDQPKKCGVKTCDNDNSGPCCDSE